MSSTSCTRIPLNWSNIDVFTFGKGSIYGYDSLNHYIIVRNLSKESDDRIHLASSPSWPIRRLILNEDESILALLADKLVYLVYLSPSNNPNQNHSPSKERSFCSILRVPLPMCSSSTPVACSLIDFVWLTSLHFSVVYSAPSASECHIYGIRSCKPNGIELIRTCSVGFYSKDKFGTPSKKISLHQPSDIIKLDRTRRKDKNIDLILLLAMKTDGDIFLLEIDENELLTKNKMNEDFQGPICILPTTFDNYGSDHGRSTFVCLSESNLPLIVFTRDQIQVHHSLILSPSSNQYYLYTIDFLSFPTNQTGQMLAMIVRDSFNSNRYFLSDSLTNVYSVEITWTKQIQQGSKQLQSTNIQHLINGNNSNGKILNLIQQMAVIQTDQSYLAVINKSLTDQQRELILVRLPTLTNEMSPFESNPSQFIDYLRSLLIRHQSIPYLTLSSTTKNLSDSDFNKNLSSIIQICINEYIQKQENVRKEIENKQCYLTAFQQTQTNESKLLTQKIQQIQQRFQTLSAKYQQECSRRKRLSTHIDDLLSIIEQNIPVLSDAEIRMQQQLETYQTQINYLKEKIQLLQQFISTNQNQKQTDRQSMQNMANYLHSQKSQIEQMKKRLETIQNNQ